MNDLRRLWGFGAQVRGRLFTALLLGVVASGAAIGLTATAAYLISKASQQPPILTLSVAIVAVRFFGISRGVARYAERLVGHDAAFGALTALRTAVYRQLEHLAPSGVALYRSGDLLSRFVADVDASQELFLRVVPPFAIALVLGIVTSAFVAWLLPVAGLICAVGLLVAALLVPRVSAASSRRAENVLAGDRSRLSSQMLQLLDALPELVASGASGAEQRKVEASYATLRQTESRLARGLGVGAGLSSLILGVTVAGCLLAGVSAVDAGQLDGVLLAVVVLTPLAAFDLTSPLPSAYQQWLSVRGASDRVFAILDAEPAVHEPVHPAPAPKPPLAIELDAVDVRWPHADSLTLHELTLSVGQGERIAIVGPSGSGKSTTAALLLGFLQPEAGAVRWNDVDAQDFDSDELRTRIGLLTQDGYVFDSSIEENLRIGKRDASKDQLHQALADARLLAWVEQLPTGLATGVGEHGTRLSGGQRQRLCLARLLLADFPVMVFDEPGEHLDTETAQGLMADLLRVTSSRTTVLITHRLSGLEQTDKIVVFDSGRIVESGPHEELVTAGGWYGTNWQLEQDRITMP